jgi:hypothetical protein
MKPARWGCCFPEPDSLPWLADFALSLLSSLPVPLRLRAGLNCTPLILPNLGDPGRLWVAWAFGEAAGVRSSRNLGLGFGTKTKELRAAGGALGDLKWGQTPFSGLSWLAMCIANILALVVLYLRIGALPAILFRQVQHVGVVQWSTPQPSRSCTMYLHRREGQQEGECKACGRA